MDTNLSAADARTGQRPLHVTPLPNSFTPSGRSAPTDDRLRPAVATLLERHRTSPIVETVTDPAGPLDVVIEHGHGPEGYALEIGGRAVVRASAPAGAFYGLVTLDQLLKAGELPAGTIEDSPRFAWRGLSLDVVRRFFPVHDVKQILSTMAYLKLNTLHLHLSDDQGWRIEIPGWPKLTEIGADHAVGDRPGGFYTTADYVEIVEFAQNLGITVIPEIDLPGHTNALVLAYPQFNRKDAGDLKPGDTADRHLAPLERYTGTKVGFSCVDTEGADMFAFLRDVFGHLASITPGAYLHFGGDEVLTLQKDRYIAFVEQVARIIVDCGKTPVGWQESGVADLPAGAVAQFWNANPPFYPALEAAVEKGTKLLMSPAFHTYLDMKYDESTPVGQTWCGVVPVRKSYEWEPTTFLPEVSPEKVVGVEAALWCETVEHFEDAAYLLMPRLAAVAEVGWTRPELRDWDDFARRVDFPSEKWSGRS